MGKIIESIDQIIAIEDDYGNFTDEQNLIFVINKAIKVKEMLEDL